MEYKDETPFLKERWGRIMDQRNEMKKNEPDSTALKYPHKPGKTHISKLV